MPQKNYTHVVKIGTKEEFLFLIIILSFSAGLMNIIILKNIAIYDEIKFILLLLISFLSL